MIGLHYPEVIENQPLEAPKSVVEIIGDSIRLEDGRTLKLDLPEANSISNLLSQSNFEIDLEPGGGNTYVVYARQEGWVCGTPWAQPIQIPLFKDTVYKNKRRLVFIAELTSSAENPARK